MKVTSEHSAGQSPNPTGLGKLARQIARRTTDLLAIAIVATGLLAVGGRVSEWWGTDAESFELAAHSGVDGSASPWGTSGGPVSLGLGDGGFRLQRQIVDGDRTSVSDSVLELCRQIVERSETTPPSAPADAEQRLLDQLKTVAPTEQQSGVWRLYQLPETLPVVVGTRRANGLGESEKAGASDGWRVVCWGLAFPMDETRWMVFAAQTSGEPTGAVGEKIEAALPPGSRRIMSLRGETGESFAAFSGHGPADEWIRFFNTWFEQHKWRRIGAWHSGEMQHTARFRREDQSAAWLADVHFQQDNGHWRGLLQLTPIAKSEREEQP